MVTCLLDSGKHLLLMCKKADRLPTPSYSGRKNKFGRTEINLCPTAAADHIQPFAPPNQPTVLYWRVSKSWLVISWRFILEWTLYVNKGCPNKHICIIYPPAAVAVRQSSGQHVFKKIKEPLPPTWDVPASTPCLISLIPTCVLIKRKEENIDAKVKVKIKLLLYTP